MPTMPFAPRHLEARECTILAHTLHQAAQLQQLRLSKMFDQSLRAVFQQKKTGEWSSTNAKLVIWGPVVWDSVPLRIPMGIAGIQATNHPLTISWEATLEKK